MTPPAGESFVLPEWFNVVHGMKKILYNSLVTLILLGLSLLAVAHRPGPGSRIAEGYVRGGGAGLQGVVVTDGVHTTLTDAKGWYQLACSEGAQFVYLSAPAGYQPPVTAGVVQFFYPLGTEGKKYRRDFLLEKTGDDTRHAFLALADVQLLREEEFPLLETAIADIREHLQAAGNLPFHALDCGDIIFDRPENFPRYVESMRTLGIPVFRVAGNHDLDYNGRSNDRASLTFQKWFGPDYYSFNRGKIHYVVLNDVFYLGREYFYIGYLPERQLEWLSRDLSHLAPGTTVVVALHIPTYRPGENFKTVDYSRLAHSLVNNTALYQILQPFKVHIVSGHNHTAAKYLIAENLKEHNVAALSGSWWQSSVCPDGTPAGYAVFEANGSELSWYYKSVGHPVSHQLRVSLENMEETGRRQVTANVWNWDPAWRVKWFEDGVDRGEMEPFSGKDPLAVQLLSDKSKMVHKWISAGTCDHLFRAFPSPGAAQVTVEVTDRFGASFRETINLNK